jgi:2-iminobutanoate/2-iminopropanoate deaminase
VRSEFFGANPPASTLVQISNLAIPDALIEIEAVAALES